MDVEIPSGAGPDYSAGPGLRALGASCRRMGW